MKPFWKSRTFWLNALAGVGLLAQGQFGDVLDPETAALVLAGANLALRFLTREPVSLR